MATVTLPMASRRQTLLPALVRTGLAVGVSDAFFASSLALLVPPTATFARLWQGVASVPFGKGMLTGGLPAAAVGLAVHFCVAFFWSALFVLALRVSPALRDALTSWRRAILVASIYGMSIWLIMSLVVIPVIVHRPPAIGPKWWILLIGHIPFVAMPMVLANRRRTST
jgi:hypothetical protein